MNTICKSSRLRQHPLEKRGKRIYTIKNEDFIRAHPCASVVSPSKFVLSHRVKSVMLAHGYVDPRFVSSTQHINRA